MSQLLLMFLQFPGAIRETTGHSWIPLSQRIPPGFNFPLHIYTHFCFPVPPV